MSSLRATALYDYTARESDELSLRKNDVVEILQKNDDDWWQVRRGKEIGMIPSNYIYVTVSSPRESKAVASPPKWGSPVASSKYNNQTKSGDPSSYQMNDNRHNMNQSSSSSSSSSSPPPVMHSTDLRRLKELREEADKKIGALR